MAIRGFVSRIKAWLTGRKAGSGRNESVLVNGDDVDSPVAVSVEEDPPIEKAGSGLTRWARREHTISRLQEGYDRVLEMMDAIQKHMATQEDRTEKIATGISQLSRSLAELPGATQQQVQLLSGIAAQLETTTVRTQQLSDAVGELPRVVRGQTDALTGVQRQLEMASESDAHLATSLQSFERSISRLGESSEHQANAMRELRAMSDEHQRRLGEIVEQQTRRFTIMLIIVAVLAGAGIVVSTVALVLWLVR